MMTLSETNSLVTQSNNSWP